MSRLAGWWQQKSLQQKCSNVGYQIQFGAGRIITATFFISSGGICWSPSSNEDVAFSLGAAVFWQLDYTAPKFGATAATCVLGTGGPDPCECPGIHKSDSLQSALHEPRGLGFRD